MGVLKKKRRKIICGGEKFLWYVINGDRDYWERVALNDWETAFLHIISEDKSLVLTIPINAPKPYAVSKGRIFQGKPSSGRWERYLLPFEIPKIITPRIVSQIIEWASGDGFDVSQSYGGDLMY